MDLASWFSNTVTIQVPSGISNFGDLTYAAQTTVLGRLQAKRTLIKANDGTMLISDHVFYSTTEIPPDARIWLPEDSTGDNDTARRVLAVYNTHDKAGTETLYKTLL